MLLLLVAMGGLVSSVVALRRASAGGGPSRAFKASDPVSLVVGAVLVAAALAGAYVLLVRA